MATEAQNSMHNPKYCVGFILTIDDVQIYWSGDTSKTKQMKELAKQKIDYALYCDDGIYNMDPKETAECVELVNANHNILIHTNPKTLFDIEKAQKWTAPNKLIIQPGEGIDLITF
jgi:L-ascorbate metabolism protein UlaG (beta-lactamase superfamily)